MSSRWAYSIGVIGVVIGIVHHIAVISMMGFGLSMSGAGRVMGRIIADPVYWLIGVVPFALVLFLSFCLIRVGTS